MIHYRMGVKNLGNEKALPKPQTAGVWLRAMASSPGPGPLWPLPGPAETCLWEEAGAEGAFPLLCLPCPLGSRPHLDLRLYLLSPLSPGNTASEAGSSRGFC